MPKGGFKTMNAMMSLSHFIHRPHLKGKLSGKSLFPLQVIFLKEMRDG